MEEVSLQNNVVIFLYNCYTNRFVYMSDKLKVLSGLEPSSFTAENGVEFSFSRVHPAHLEAGLQFNRLGISYIAENNTIDSRSILVSINFLYKNGQDEYIQVLQQGSVLEVDENGRPALIINFIHNVGHIKKADSIGCVISAPGKVGVYNYDPEAKVLEPPVTFTDHERKIISMLAQGLDTKTISQKLFISPHTVDTHRRNLIKKLNCIDTTGVVAFARLINLIQ